MEKQKYFKENLIDNKIYMDKIYIKNNDLIKNLNNEYLPSRVVYYYNKNNEKIISSIEYFKDGKYHRENGPARIFLYNNGEVKEEHYYKNGIFFANDNITIRKYYKDKKLRSICEQIYKNYIHVTSYSKNGYLEKECWYLGPHLHRDDGPALIKYFTDDSNINKISELYYYNNGKIHRLYEPAIIYYYKNKEILAYYIDGIKYNDPLKHAIISSNYNS